MSKALAKPCPSSWLVPICSAFPSRIMASVLQVVVAPAKRLSLIHILGMLTLVVFRIPTGIRAWIEDVVVDRAAGRRGAGEALTRAALELAGELGAQTVDLTSRPSREAANRLYQKVGFEARETNVYRYRSA